MPQTIKAIVFDRALQIVERPVPSPDAGEALIRLRLGGICNTDLELMQGYHNFHGTLGHEFVGEVIDGPAEWLGLRVVGEINVGCGTCDWCQRGIPEHCRQRRVLGIHNYDGAFAEVFRLPLANLHPVPRALPDDVAVFAEPLAAACQTLECCHIRPGDRVVLLGAGKLGLLTAQVLRLTGCDLAVVARHARQKELLAGWGIRTMRREDLADGTADVVVDCTGVPQGLADAMQLVRARGTIVLKSTYASPAPLDLSPLAVNEIALVGSRCGPFAAALRLLEEGLVDVQPLIEGRYALTDAPAAFVHAARPGALKVLLVP
ncbi:MAG: alcohol dehydrogenase catalytic domain-containing protein [Anaerolineae bacterium]